MSEYKEYKLGEILNLITKGTTPPQGVGFVEKGINYIKSDAIGYDGKLDRSKFAQIDSQTHEKFKRSQLKENDILFSMAGIYLGKNAIVPKDVLPANTNQALAILRLNQQKALSKYVSYYLSQSQIIDFVNNMSGQSAQPNINFEEIKCIEISLPPLPEQRAIASVLSSLDDKIDLLHRQNQTLEKMAETLFRQWFVEEAKEDWEEGTLDNILTVKGGTTPSTSNPDYWNGHHHWTSPRDITNLDGIYLFKTERKITDAGLKKISSGLLPKGTLLMSSRAPVGVLAFAEIPLAINQGYIAIIDNKGYSKEFIFLWLKINMDYVHSFSNGSTFLEISKSAFKSLQISIPPVQIGNDFQEKIEPIFKKIKKNIIQIRTLSALRDTLLPKLMSGEVRVEIV
jgi:type I restriction enzyme S subunit